MPKITKSKITETKRVVLRPLDVSDAEAFFRLNADPDVLKFTGDSAFLSVDEARLFLEQYPDYELNGFGRWAVVSKDTNTFIGWCGLKLNEEHQVDLGFRFFQNEWGKGYATESAKAALDFGFKQLNIQEIIGRAAIENTASIKVLEKIGMRFWKYDSCEGIEDSVYFKITKVEI
ncbi:MAG: GNAT family N-acetyltransferase [Flavobacteriales bacterium]